MWPRVKKYSRPTLPGRMRVTPTIMSPGVGRGLEVGHLVDNRRSDPVLQDPERGFVLVEPLEIGERLDVPVGGADKFAFGDVDLENPGLPQFHPSPSRAARALYALLQVLYFCNRLVKAFYKQHFIDRCNYLSPKI